MERKEQLNIICIEVMVQGDGGDERTERTKNRTTWGDTAPGSM